MKRSKRKSPSANQNWTPAEVKAKIKKEAKAKLAEINEATKDKKAVYIQHPTIPKTLIVKYI